MTSQLSRSPSGLQSPSLAEGAIEVLRTWDPLLLMTQRVKVLRTKGARSLHFGRIFDFNDLQSITFDIAIIILIFGRFETVLDFFTCIF